MDAAKTEVFVVIVGSRGVSIVEEETLEGTIQDRPKTVEEPTKGYWEREWDSRRFDDFVDE
jgi:hypothetical protein